MNKRQQETAKYLLREEKKVLKELRQNYKKALNDVIQKIQILQSNDVTQSKIYQIQYQEYLKKNISELLDILNTNNTEIITEYLKECYKDGFLASLYDLQGQDVFLLYSFTDEQVTNTVMTNSAGYRFSERLYNSTELLKTQYREIASRGIATSKGYKEIGKLLAMQSEADYNKAVRIARTEGHRVQQNATMQSIVKAKELGCDIVKEWSSVLDNRTRADHKKLNGQIRKVDDYFEINGQRALYPSQFGIACQDINCRCSVLQRATWALTNEEKQRHENYYKFNANSFKNFKEEYYNVIADVKSN